MQPNENNNANMNTLNSPSENGAPTGLSSTDNAAGANQQLSATQPMAQQPNNKKTRKGLIIACLIILVLLVVGIVVAVVMMNPNKQGSSGGEQPDTSEIVYDDDEDEEEVEVGELEVEIEQTGTAEVENGVFAIKDENGTIIAEDSEMSDVTGIKSCETLEDDVQTSVRCIVSTEEGEGIFVYYPEDKALKFAEQ